jgi:dihydroorotate dehydrogenase (NAD+) catalytic subunit
MLNAYGLTNQGVIICANEMNDSRRQGFKVIPNFYPEFAQGTEIAIRQTLEAIAILQGSMKDYFEALELNFSCPNSREAIAENVVQSLACVQKIRQQYPDLLLIAKISVVHPYEFAQELERLGVQAIHGVNTIPYDNIFPPEKFAPSPLAHVGGGGVSGGPAFEQAYCYNKKLRKKVNLFLIMGCGVRNKDDVRRYFDLGADAVSFCTLALRNPAAAGEIINAFTTASRFQV